MPASFKALRGDAAARAYSSAPARVSAPAHRVAPWMWPNLLSLDAPAVAVAWQAIFARAFGAPLDAAQAAVLALYVWMVYVADRTLDGLRADDPSHGTARHRFYREHWMTFAPAFAIAAAAAAYLSLVALGSALARGYGLLAAAGTIYFVCVHAAAFRVRRRWPKELAVAVLFAAGVCMPVLVARDIAWRSFAPACALFALALWINALGIECWEHALDRNSRRRLPSPLSRALAICLEPAAWTAAGIAAAFAIAGHADGAASLVYACVAASAAMLAVVEERRERMGRDSIRVLADAALLPPVAVFAAMLLERMR